MHQRDLICTTYHIGSSSSSSSSASNSSSVAVVATFAAGTAIVDVTGMAPGFTSSTTGTCARQLNRNTLHSATYLMERGSALPILLVQVPVLRRVPLCDPVAPVSWRTLRTGRPGACRDISSTGTWCATGHREPFYLRNAARPEALDAVWLLRMDPFVQLESLFHCAHSPIAAGDH